MTPSDTTNLVDSIGTKNLCARKHRFGSSDKLSRLGMAEKAHFEYLHVHKITRPVDLGLATHFINSAYTTKEQNQARTILYDTTEPIEEQPECHKLFLSRLVELFKFIESQ